MRNQLIMKKLNQKNQQESKKLKIFDQVATSEFKKNKIEFEKNIEKKYIDANNLIIATLLASQKKSAMLNI